MTQGSRKYTAGKLYDLNIAEVALDGTQPRRYFDEQALAELTTSIKKHGVLQPVLVRASEKGGFVLVSGERRYHACLAARLATIPAIVTKGNPMEVAIVENLLREDLTAIEEAEAIERLKTTHGYQLSDLSEVLGKGESTLCEILSLNKLPDQVKEECRSDPKAARGILAEIARQRNTERMVALYEKYRAMGLTRGEIRHDKARLKATATEAEEGIDIAFLARCTRQLDAIEVEKIDSSQRELFLVDLNALRLAVNRKLKAVRPLSQPA